MGNEPSVLMINPRPNSNLSILDEGSLLEVFKYLGMFELLQLAEIDINYRRMIGEHIISKQTLDITGISPNYETRGVFKCFGEFVQALSIRESDIQYKNERYTFAEEIFRLIKKRCVADRLKAFDICFDSKDWTKKPYNGLNATQFLDVFGQVEAITISKPTPVQYGYSQRDKCLDEFLQKVFVHCTQLRSLKLINLSCEFGFLGMAQLRRLQSLEFEQCHILLDGWLKFMADAGVRPQLKSLIFDRTEFCAAQQSNQTVQNLRSILQTDQFLRSITTAFPNLETFDLIHHYSMFVYPNCSAFQALGKLKELRLRAGIFPNLFETLAVNATIERLTLSRTGSSDVGIDQLINLRSIELCGVRPNMYTICEAFARLPQLVEMVLHDSTDIISDEQIYQLIRQLVTVSPQLRVLKLSIPYSALSVALYKQLVTIRRNRFPNGPPLELYASFKTFPSRSYDPNVVAIFKKPKHCYM